MADVITLNASNLPTSGYLTTGTYNGTFDGTGLLPSAYTVNYLNFDFKFTDDSNDPFANINGIVTSSEVLTATNGNNRTATLTTTYFVPVQSNGESESIKLSFGSLSFMGQTQAGTTVTGAPVTQTGQPARVGTIWVKGSANNGVEKCSDAEIRERNPSCKEVPYFTVTKTVTTTNTTDYTGMLSFNGSLLTSLFKNDKLDFTMDVTGDLFLTSATLDVTYTNDAVIPPGAVPEPGSLALLGIAMLGAVGVSRKRQK